MSKNIVILSDGTGQDGGTGHDSNVYKLFRMLEDRTERQVVFYDQGIGTQTQRLTGMAFGAGIDTNILQCYRFLFDHYQAGDKIFLFGFSRGAATVRSLASFLHYFGILPASRPELIAQAYKIYRNRKVSYHQSVAGSQQGQGTSNTINRLVYRWNDAFRDDLDQDGGKSSEFVRLHPNQWVQIEFLGVWDTVPALGLAALPGLDTLVDHIPAWKHQYHNFKLRGSVKHACHALSIDDERKWFFPSIWKEYDPDLTEQVEQVWFGGAHTDVGGGFWEAGFSDIALEWMVQKAFEHGLHLYFDSRPEWNFCLAPDATDEFHDPRSAWGVFYASGVRDSIWDEKAFETFGPPRLHESVIERARYLPYTAESPTTLWEKARLYLRRKLGYATGQGYGPWILQPEHYPDQQKMEAWFQKHYSEVWAPRAYKKWCAAQDPQAELPSLEEWISQPANSFARWMAENTAFDSFQGREILVEKTRPVVFNPAGEALVLRQDADRNTLRLVQPPAKILILRDYDQNTLAQVLQDALLYPSLRNRVRRYGTKSGKLSRAQRRALAKDPHAIPYQYRVDRDAQRWKVRPTETPASPPAD